MELWKILNAIFGWEYVLYTLEHLGSYGRTFKFSKILRVHRGINSEPYVEINEDRNSEHSKFNGIHLIRNLEKDKKAEVTWLTEQKKTQEDN